MLKFDRETIEKIQLLDARKTVGYALNSLYKKNKKVVAVYADVGSRFGLIGSLQDNGVEVGISEQSLINILGGMAHEGFIPFGVAYAPFITMRAADQIRMTVGEMGMNINLIGGSAGLISGNLGSASLSLDDIAMMRAIPNIKIISPADSLEIAKALDKACEEEMPVYIRLTGDKLPRLYSKDYLFEIGKAVEVYQSGEDVVIYVSGALVTKAIQAAILLDESGIKSTVINMHTIKPLDIEILKRFSHVPYAVTVEEHSIIGGLGSAIAEYVCEYNKQKLLRLGVRDRYPRPDTYNELLKNIGLTDKGIAKEVKMFLMKN